MQTPDSHHRFPPQVISHAAWLYNDSYQASETSRICSPSEATLSPTSRSGVGAASSVLPLAGRSDASRPIRRYKVHRRDLRQDPWPPSLLAAGHRSGAHGRKKRQLGLLFTGRELPSKLRAESARDCNTAMGGLSQVHLKYRKQSIQSATGEPNLRWGPPERRRRAGCAHWPPTRRPTNPSPPLNSETSCREPLDTSHNMLMESGLGFQNVKDESGIPYGQVPCLALTYRTGRVRFSILLSSTACRSHACSCPLPTSSLVASSSMVVGSWSVDRMRGNTAL